MNFDLFKIVQFLTVTNDICDGLPTKYQTPVSDVGLDDDIAF